MTFKADTTFGFVPRYTVHVPHRVMVQLGAAKNVAKACAALAAYIVNPGMAVGPLAIAAAAGLAIFAAWLAAELYFMKEKDKGCGVNLTTWISPLQPYWIPSTAPC
ncbi:hypothetical protein [Methylobacterium crusticola]|uniref:hypothetical protein n=1 Tax=Methylobacterium crusticola TaxID=1697972 RepID=UPI000FFB8DFF|nr:hypothetical protein [Methylobacterium crusticola]